MRIQTVIVLLAGVTASTWVHADLLGVEDAALLAKTVEQVNTLYKQLETMEKTYSTTVQQYQATQNILNKAEAQLDSMNKLVSKNSGHYGYGDLNNSTSDLRKQQWSANRWSDSLKGQAGNDNGKYKELSDAWQTNHKTQDMQTFKKGASNDVAQNYQHSMAVNRASGVQSEYALNEVNASLERIHQLSQQIEKADNTKAAVDLNSRLLTEVAYLQTQNLKAQSLINQQLAQKQAVELSERATTSEFLAFDDE